MAQWRNTQYTEFAPESPNERFGLGSTALTRQFDLVDGSFKGRMQAAYDFLGYGQVLATGSPSMPYYLHRVTPMPYPALGAGSFAFPNPADAKVNGAAMPDMTQAFWANGISRTKPLGAPSGVDLNANPGGVAAAKYTRARLTMEFSTLPFQIKEDSAVMVNGFPFEGYYLEINGWASTRYIIRQVEPFSRIIKIPYGIINVNGKETKQAMPLREAGANISYTWMRVPLTGGAAPGVNFKRLGLMLQTINQASFDGFPSRTLLFDSYSTHEYQGSFGERLADVKFNLIYLPHPSTGKSVAAAGTAQGWNSIYDLNADRQPDYYPALCPDGVSPPFTVVANVLDPDSGAPLQFRDLFRP